MHPHQAHYHSLEEAAYTLSLLVDESVDWAYAFVQLNGALSHAPLLSEGHVSTMMDGAPSTDAYGWLHQLQICRLLQHKDVVVCPEGLNSKLEALQFTFQELPFWDAATPSKPTHTPQQIEVDLSSMQPESMSTAIPVPNTTLVLPHSLANTIEPPIDITMTVHLQLQGPWNGCSRLSLQPQACPPTQYAEERAAISGPGGSTLNQRNRRFPWARGDGLCHPCPNGNPHADISVGGHTRWDPNLHLCYSLTAPANHAKGTGGIEHVDVPPGSYQSDCQISYFCYRRK